MLREQGQARRNKLTRKLAKSAARRHLAPLPKPVEPDAKNADAAPGLAFRELRFGMVVSPAAGDHRDLVAALDQAHGNLGQILPGRHHVRVEGLVEEEEGQKEKQKSKDKS